MTHALGFDWEYGVAVDDDENGFLDLVSPANKHSEGERIQIAEYLGLPTPRGFCQGRSIVEDAHPHASHDHPL